jgi:plastocyanin
MPDMPRTPISLLLVAVVGAGCGEQTEPPASSAAPAPSEAPAAAAATADVEIKGFTYSPARVTVRQGGKVSWTDADASNHTVTFAKDGPQDVENLREGRSATVTFRKRGSYAYICDFHPGMAGTVAVR